MIDSIIDSMITKWLVSNLIPQNLNSPGLCTLASLTLASFKVGYDSVNHTYSGDIKVFVVKISKFNRLLSVKTINR